uniref:Coiled-coil domain-containing protein 149 n=1 Tax=Anopheles dirus TaxID=7168 RepID=A0A182N567_9DIPT
MANSTMARGRKHPASAPASKSNHMDTESDEQEYTVLSRKLQSKVEALKIMRYELEKCRTERDQFKLMAETIQLRYSAIKNSLNAPDFQAAGFGNSSAVSLLVKQTRERNEALTTEVESLKQRLYDLEGDIKVVRARNVELQDICSKLRTTNESLLSTNGDKTWQAEKSQLIAQLEQLRKRNAQLQYDFRSLLDEKEETVTERDAYKCKAHRLNHELNVALRGSGAGSGTQTLLDIDGLILENKYQTEKIANIENELGLARQAASKYKSMLETNRKKGIIKLGTNNNNKTIMSHSQVKHLLENGTVDELPLRAATISDLKSLCLALLDNVNDKSLALAHQKKTNKLLATKIAELERHVKTLAGCDDRATMASLSPSQYLLNGYSSATVDQDKDDGIIVRHSIETTELSPEQNSSSGPSQSGQRTEPLSSGSNKSCVLSCTDDEDDDVGDGRRTGDSETTNTNTTTSNTEELQAAIAQLVASVERDLSTDEQLPQLPDDIAALIEQLKESSEDSKP